MLPTGLGCPVCVCAPTYVLKGRRGSAALCARRPTGAGTVGQNEGVVEGFQEYRGESRRRE